MCACCVFVLPPLWREYFQECPPTLQRHKKVKVQGQSDVSPYPSQMIAHFAPSYVAFFVRNRYKMNKNSAEVHYSYKCWCSFLYVTDKGKRLIETTSMLMMFSKWLTRNYFLKKKRPHRVGSWGRLIKFGIYICFFFILFALSRRLLSHVHRTVHVRSFR